MIPMLDGNTRGKTTVGAAVGFVRLGSAIVKGADEAAERLRGMMS